MSEHEHEQPTLFDAELAELAALEGMELAENADRVQEWKQAASTWLGSQAVGLEFTADDLVRAVGVADIGANRNNVLGAWVNAQRAAGRLEFAGRLRKSERVSRHGGLQRVWIVRYRSDDGDAGDQTKPAEFARVADSPSTDAPATDGTDGRAL